jgi:hypothetical protein
MTSRSQLATATRRRLSMANHKTTAVIPVP